MLEPKLVMVYSRLTLIGTAAVPFVLPLFAIRIVDCVYH